MTSLLQQEYTAQNDDQMLDSLLPDVKFKTDLKLSKIDETGVGELPRHTIVGTYNDVQRNR